MWHDAPYWVLTGSMQICKQLNPREICPALIQMVSFALQVSCWASRGPKVWPRSSVQRTAPNASTWLWFTRLCLPRSAPLWNDPEIWAVAYSPLQITRAASTPVYSSKPSSPDCITQPPTTAPASTPASLLLKAAQQRWLVPYNVSSHVIA